MRKHSPFKQFNWRILLIRVLVNALALGFVVLVVPAIYFIERSVWTWFVLAIGLGILNAIVKPIVQFLTLPFIFSTYGVVIIIINMIVLVLLSWLFPNLLAVNRFLGAFLGGAIMGITSSFLESLFGLTPPLLPEKQTEYIKQLDYPSSTLEKLVLKENKGSLQILTDEVDHPDSHVVFGKDKSEITDDDLSFAPKVDITKEEQPLTQMSEDDFADYAPPPPVEKTEENSQEEALLDFAPPESVTEQKNRSAESGDTESFAQSEADIEEQEVNDEKKLS